MGHFFVLIYFRNDSYISLELFTLLFSKKDNPLIQAILSIFVLIILPVNNPKCIVHFSTLVHYS